MRINNGLINDNRRFFDVCAIIFLVVHFFFLFLNWHNYPTELDTPYHLLMGKMFADSGKIVLWDSYEFAPLGRPHLYPPLEYLLIWFMHTLTRLSYMDVGRILAIGQGGLGLFFVWLISRKFFNAAIAFFSVIFFASNTDMWWWQTSVAPVALVTVLFLPFIYFYYKKKVLLPVVLLTSCLYLHYGLSFTMVTTVLLASLCDAKYRKEYLKNFFIIFGVSVLLFTPWLLYIYEFKDYFFNRTIDVGTLLFFSLEIYFREVFFNLNNVLWLFLGVGLFYCYKHIKEDFKYSLLVAGFWSYFIYLFLFQGSRFNAHSPIVTSVFAGIGFFGS